MSGPTHAPSDLAGLVHDALVERTSDHAWAEEAAAHVAAVIEAAGYLSPEQAREREAAAWFDGYRKGNLDGYFGTSDERAKSPYVDLDPFRDAEGGDR